MIRVLERHRPPEHSIFHIWGTKALQLGDCFPNLY